MKNDNMEAVNDYMNWQYPDEPDGLYFECLEARLFRSVKREEKEAIKNIYSKTVDTKKALAILLKSYRSDFKNITGSELNDTMAVKRAERALV